MSVLQRVSTAIFSGTHHSSASVSCDSQRVAKLAVILNVFIGILYGFTTLPMVIINNMHKMLIGVFDCYDAQACACVSIYRNLVLNLSVQLFL